MRSWPGALAFVAAILPIAAHAQVAGGAGGAATAPQIDPGLILQQNRGNQRQLEEQNAPQIDGPSVVAPGRGPQITTPAGGPKVLLRSVVFDPSTFLTKEELDAIAARFVSRRVDISDIQKLVKEVNDLFAAKGVVTATAYLPPQKLDSGVLHVGIVEGKLETVTVKGTVALMPQFVIKEFGGEPGTVVDINQVSDRVALINKTGFAQVQAFLQPGSQFGLTDIQLAVTEPPVNAFDAFLDNQGVPAVGRLEEGLLFQHYGLFGIDDKLTFYGVRSDGDLAGNLAYSLPFDTSGGRVGVSYNRGTIRVVNGPFAPLHITGNSMIGAINASQPLFVSQNWLVLATAAGSFYESISKQQDITITHNDTIRETGGLTVGYTNGQFSTSLAGTYTHGRTRFDVTDDHQNFALVNATYTASLFLPEGFLAAFVGGGQYSPASVLPGDQLFQIGGAASIRGYNTGLLAGPKGYYGDFQLEHGLEFITPGLSAFGFFDTGAVYNISPSVLRLNAAGVGLSWDLKKRILAELTVGFPLTGIPQQTIAPYQAYFRVTARF